MAIEKDEVGMISASLNEYLKLARIGIFQNPVLGYPTATILFAFIDAVGSYHRGVASFRICVDNADLEISQTDHHLRILNSEYFGMNLTSEQINRLYRLTRSPLTHNGLAGAGTCLLPGDAKSPAIEEIDGLIWVRLANLLALSEAACSRFLAVADTIVPGSTVIRELRQKERQYEAQIEKAMAALKKLGPMESMSATAMASNPIRKK